MHEGLEPALQVWAYVQSIPEAEKAIIAMGKRDAAFDSGLPVPALHYRPGDAEPETGSGALERDEDDGSACVYEVECGG